MKKIIILALLLTSCATKKVKDTETEIQVDSSTTKETKVTEKETTKKETISDYKAETISFEPIDIKIPYYVDGKKYENVKVTNKTESEYKKINEEQQKVIESLINEITKLKAVLEQQTRDKEKDYTQVIESVTNRLFWLIIIIVIILIVFSFIKKKLSI